MGKNCYFWHGVRLSLSLKFSAVASQAGKQKERVMLYPIGIQNFESLRKGGFTYVDKTELIYQLAATGRYYFLGRPRRFGKSLLLSTMEAYFQGKKELFKGLAIENQETDWTEYPVLHLDWGGATYTSESIFNDKIENALRRWEQEYGIDNVLTADSVRFENIIDAAYGKTGKPVVILIDEYDKPIVDNLDREELVPEPIVGFLQRDESAGRQDSFRIPDGHHQDRPAEHLQRSQQFARHFDGSPLRGLVRDIGRGPAPVFR